MIDRIKLTIADLTNYDHAAPWSCASTLDLETTWKVVEIMNSVREKDGTIKRTAWVVATHKPTGSRIEGPKSFGPVNFEGSLPRLLWGSNGRLIKNQLQLDDAMDRARQLVQALAPDAQFRLLKICTIELPLHFLGETAEWVAFYCGLKHPKIEANPSVFENAVMDDLNTSGGPGHCAVRWSADSVSWMGKYLKISLYNKYAEMGVPRSLHPPEGLMRLEFKLLGDHCAGLIKRGVLSFDECYKRYREFAQEFRNFNYPSDMYDSSMNFIHAMQMLGHIPAYEYQRFICNRSSRSLSRDQAIKRGLNVWHCRPGVISRLPEEGFTDFVDAVDSRRPAPLSYCALKI